MWANVALGKIYVRVLLHYYFNFSVYLKFQNEQFLKRHVQPFIVIFFSYLRSKDKGLHESPQSLVVIREQAHHLDHHTVIQGGMSIDMTDLSVAIGEIL